MMWILCVRCWQTFHYPYLYPGNWSWLYVIFPSHKIIGSPVWYHVWMVWLFSIILIILGWPSFSSPLPSSSPLRWYKVRTSLPPFSHACYQAWPAPPPLPLLCGRSPEWSDLTINTESKWKVLQYSLAATRTCGYYATHSASSSATPLIIIPQERVSNSFLVTPLEFLWPPLGCGPTGPASQARLPSDHLPSDHHENHLIWVDWSLLVPVG
jgi:hypothetical protein